MTCAHGVCQVTAMGSGSGSDSGGGGGGGGGGSGGGGGGGIDKVVIIAELRIQAQGSLGTLLMEGAGSSVTV